ncbi:MAG: hypothetical protein FJZ56_02990 [Chlamydiae bacterium]|nr:hypothetical protein [Chlamydiota bacterium]
MHKFWDDRFHALTELLRSNTFELNTAQIKPLKISSISENHRLGIRQIKAVTLLSFKSELLTLKQKFEINEKAKKLVK